MTDSSAMSDVSWVASLSENTQFEIPPACVKQVHSLRLVRGLSKDDVYMLSALIVLSTPEKKGFVAKSELIDYLKVSGQPSSDSTIKNRSRLLLKLGVFSRYEVPRPRKKPVVVYRLNDLTELMTSDLLASRDDLLNEETDYLGRQTLMIDDPIMVISSRNHYPHAYSRKISHLLLRRCCRNPSALGKKVPLHLRGYGETVYVVQRTASGVPPMDGSEDRQQQALLTMFKEHLKALSTRMPELRREDFKNEWVLDLRQFCKTMGLKPSNGNIIVQAKKLYQLRYNSFEIYFDPKGKVATSLNLSINGGQDDFIMDDEVQSLHRLRMTKVDQYCLSHLEPLIDEVVWSAQKQTSMFEGLDDEEAGDSEPAQAVGKPYAPPLPTASADEVLTEMVTDRSGRPYRFYRLRFHPHLFEECLDDTLLQINKNSPTMLQEDRTTARLLAYMAQRICTIRRSRPFETTWGDLIEEIQPAEESAKVVYQRMERVFKSDYVPTSDCPVWSPYEGCVVELHGFCFRTTVPPGKGKSRKDWRITIWRDADNPYTGDEGPAARARFLSEMKELVGVLPAPVR